ncbi:uncharacterized protein LOC133832690 [Humulus lupulus]|uniref:uncharacterized protein LOC133832690 n=1 Tax=Humulus lupulus TaxID=3486 RepID=UPI002B40F519|nr:uncharacterized protein LOC133832690 [Humulus lupulus]
MGMGVGYCDAVRFVIMIAFFLFFFSKPTIEARKLMAVKSNTLVISPPGYSPGSQLWAEMKPKGVPIPPSGPSTRHSPNPPLPLRMVPKTIPEPKRVPVLPPKPLFQPKGVFVPDQQWSEMKPKGAPIPPSGPSNRHSPDTPEPKNRWFEMKPKGAPIPPSGPNNRHSPDPPEPKPNGLPIPVSEKKWFEMKPKGVPIPPSGPNKGHNPIP